MTRKTNARIAGVTFLFYIAAGVLSMVLFGRAASGDGIGEKLAAIAQHSTDVRIVVVLGLLEAFCALVLGVTLYAITREQDPDLAMLGLVSRVGEGVIGASIPVALGLLWLATASGANAPDAPTARGLAAFLLRVDGWGTLISATFFAVGSTFFSWLLLRGRMIPLTLAWLGVGGSMLLVACLPLQLAGFLSGPLTSLMWIPIAVFEVVLALWLLVKGVAPPARSQST
ncbi:MAG: DUF4386 domain-containing protein [Gemmatimonadota bacterium]|nr:DUF4386 domain-containing protein [Gemmatimonadota bacterium]